MPEILIILTFQITLCSENVVFSNKDPHLKAMWNINTRGSYMRKYGNSKNSKVYKTKQYIYKSFLFPFSSIWTECYSKYKKFINSKLFQKNRPPQDVIKKTLTTTGLQGDLLGDFHFQHWNLLLNIFIFISNLG